jgi:hypothetical protein
MFYQVPIPYIDKTESVEEFRVRMQVTSIAITFVCNEAVNRRIWSSRKMCVASLYTLGKFESWFKRNIGENKCGKYECDPDPITGEPRAISYWQVHRIGKQTKEEWLKYGALNLENVTMAAWRACTLMASAYKYCKSYEGMYSLYGSGNTCSNKLGVKRRDEMFKTLQLIKEW